ncbi:FAD-dependent monooxygenase [Streptomyces sp. NPDC050433]|uniref:FAD-dependent monooxygenase n=1 Tax=unclassified Streptomyces TaxID=2593676 RepID=UPI00342DD311
MRTTVGIVGGGPAGLLLARLLHNAGVGSVVLERRDRAPTSSAVSAPESWNRPRWTRCAPPEPGSGWTTRESRTTGSSCGSQAAPTVSTSPRSPAVDG